MYFFIYILILSDLLFFTHSNAQEIKSGFPDGFVLVPAGSFTMGSPVSEPGRDGNEDEHKVTLTRAFYMGKHEVTQGEWKRIMGNNPSGFPDCGDDCPVEQVSWFDAVNFCNALSVKEKLTPVYVINGDSVACNQSANGYRLPTESEWEYAGRAGTSTAFYNGEISNPGEDPNMEKIGWCNRNSELKTHAVEKKNPNAFGLFDMSGNVWEWCWDRNSDYASGKVIDPKSKVIFPERIARGGSWGNIARYGRAAKRHNCLPTQTDSRLGFRIVRNIG
jgi:formylglycine-generating enzyme required for sulfatase activity